MSLAACLTISFNHLRGLYRFVGSLRSFFRSADFMK